MHWEPGWIDAAGYFASALVFATFCMRTMIPLRIVGMTSNVAFIIYGFAGHIYPVAVLHLILLPMNMWRFAEMVRLIRRVDVAARGDLSTEWLEPFMKSVRLEAGEILFRRGDPADKLYLILAGRVAFEEISVTCGPGELFGEIALFSAQHTRTQTARCVSHVELLWINERELAQLCYQNPAIAFHLLRLITNRLIENGDKAQALAGRGEAATFSSDGTSG